MSVCYDYIASGHLYFYLCQQDIRPHMHALQLGPSIPLPSQQTCDMRKEVGGRLLGTAVLDSMRARRNRDGV